MKDKIESVVWASTGVLLLVINFSWFILGTYKGDSYALIYLLVAVWLYRAVRKRVREVLSLWKTK